MEVRSADFIGVDMRVCVSQRACTPNAGSYKSPQVILHALRMRWQDCFWVFLSLILGIANHEVGNLIEHVVAALPEFAEKTFEVSSVYLLFGRSF
jgi:hypothetical protein